MRALATKASLLESGAVATVSLIALWVLVSAIRTPSKQGEDLRLVRTIFYAYKMGEADAGAKSDVLAIPDGLYHYLSVQDGAALKAKLEQGTIHFEISMADPDVPSLSDEVLLTCDGSAGESIVLYTDATVSVDYIR